MAICCVYVYKRTSRYETSDVYINKSEIAFTFPLLLLIIIIIKIQK